MVIMMTNLTPEFAEILGLLCAEGSHIISYSSYWGKDKGKDRYFKNDKSERIEFTNKNRNLLEHYKKLLGNKFNYYPKFTKHFKINICKKSIINSIISETKLGNQKWNVPKSILNSNDQIKLSFIRGYFDGDGCSSKGIRFTSVNKVGLRNVSKILNYFKFKHSLQGPSFREGRKPIYTIQLSRRERERFLKKIQPFSK